MTLTAKQRNKTLTPRQRHALTLLRRFGVCNAALLRVLALEFDIHAPDKGTMRSLVTRGVVSVDEEGLWRVRA